MKLRNDVYCPFVPLVLALLLAGCSKSNTPGQRSGDVCASSNDCEGAESCLFGSCVTLCAADDPACCDPTTCNARGTCSIVDDVAVCDCVEGHTGATCYIETDTIPPDLLGLSDPTDWANMNDIWFRRVTEQEADTLRISPATYLVSNAEGVSGILDDDFFIKLTLPIDDENVTVVDLQRTGGVAGPPETIEMVSAAGAAQAIVNYDATFDVWVDVYQDDTGAQRTELASLGAIMFDRDRAGLSGRLIVPVRDQLFHIELMRLPYAWEPHLELGALSDGGNAPPADDAPFLFVVTLVNPTLYVAYHSEACFTDMALCDKICGFAQPWDISECGHPCCSIDSPPSPVNHQCNNSLDDDGDGTADSSDSDCQHSQYCGQAGMPEHTHRWEAGVDFGVFGDIAYCTKFAPNHFAEIYKRTAYTANTYQALTGNSDYDGLAGWTTQNKVVRHSLSKCWVLEDAGDPGKFDLAAAQQCRDNGGSACGPFASGTHAYPYAGAGFTNSGYFAHLRDDIKHAVKVGMNHPISPALIVSEKFMLDSGSQNQAGVQGTATGGGGVGALVSWTSPYIWIPHEIGHNLSLEHCYAEFNSEANGFTVMGTGEQGVSCVSAPVAQQFSVMSAMHLYHCFMNTHDVQAGGKTYKQHCFKPPHFGNY